MDAAELVARATEFAFLPAGAVHSDVEVDHYTVFVARRSEGRWAIIRSGRCWDADSQAFVYEPRSSYGDHDFLRRCRFCLDDAVRIASAMPDILTTNGRTWAELKAFNAARGV